MKHIVDLAKNRGFVFPGSEIYGGLANSWDYGPWGSILKENLKNLWIREMVQKRPDMVYQDAAILMNPKVWEASGHVGGFSDPLVDDKSTKERFRADKLIEEYFFERTQSGVSEDDQLKEYKDKYGVENLIPEAWDPKAAHEFLMGEKIENPNTGEPGDWTEIRHFNLMFKTSQGVTDDSSSTVYLRPETAQGIFVDFPNIIRSTRKKLPLGVAQVGKAFRNEITPGNFIFRTREFEQMEIEYFCSPESASEHFEKWKEKCINFLRDTVGLKDSSLRFRQHDTDEMAHYSADCFDIEFDYPGMGFKELWGIANRTDYDLTKHMEHSGENMSYMDPYTNTKYIPHVIEPSVGLTRLVLATLCDAYDEVEDEKQGKRIIMRFAPEVAPIKVGVLPLVKKLGDKAHEIYAQLGAEFMCEYDDAGSIGKRYARFDEIGTPWCVTVDYDTLDDESVTVRDRDTAEQERVKISELNQYIQDKIKTYEMPKV